MPVVDIGGEIGFGGLGFCSSTKLDSVSELGCVNLLPLPPSN